ncbi:unnamed protein product [Phytophthora lilii]|uniref:Unnamed protein product n=1 Tax=Phytophthora lilii TaxID=2077276 RepID=A0A9W6XHJ1_9STRA|nr:unnamed protein product [Phytophthora lilii]
MEVQGITKGKTATSRRASVKITLGRERVYVFDVWIMDHNAGVDVVLGTDFMIPARVRLDLFNATAKLPDEVMVPLIKTQNMIDETEGSHVVGEPTESNDNDGSAAAMGVGVLEKQRRIMISSGNALPPPAYGVVCDINVQGHEPIKQRARRIPMRHPKKLYELLKGLLKANLVAFSDSPWASPIVIVLKKNGVDIRLCIDYKLENAITAIMEYAMPLVDDLLTDLEAYLWFCSLDAASGFWAIMMTLRARKISAFVCPLGHFEWLRIAAVEQCRTIHAGAENSKSVPTKPSTFTRIKFAVAHENSGAADPVLDLVNHPDTEMFSTNETDQSSLVPVFDRRSFVDDICFGGRDFDGGTVLPGFTLNCEDWDDVLD